MNELNTYKKVKETKLIKYRLLNKFRNRNETIEKRMELPLKFEEEIEHKKKKYKFHKHYENYYSKHDDVVYIEV